MQINDDIAVIRRNEEIDLAALNAAMVNTVEMELIRPITVGGSEVQSLTFEEPTGKHVEMMSRAGSAAAQSEMSFRVLGECVGLAPEEVKQLRSRDLTRMGVVLRYFLPDPQAGVI